MLDANEDSRGLNQRDYAKVALLVEAAPSLLRARSAAAQVCSGLITRLTSLLEIISKKLEKALLLARGSKSVTRGASSGRSINDRWSIKIRINFLA